jgi:hypothetical protein
MSKLVLVAALAVAGVVIAGSAAGGVLRVAGDRAKAVTMYVEWTATRTGASGPGDDHVGHLQTGTGILRDLAGHRIGRSAFTCRWIMILANGDAREHCTGWAETADGRFRMDGPALRNDLLHTWTVRGVSGGYRGATGSVVLRDTSPTRTLARITLHAPAAAALKPGVVSGSAANSAFRARADALCDRAAARLASLPPFPFQNFDPLHPDPKLLPKVGRFFTGPHDSRRIQRDLIAGLRALGRPPGDRQQWSQVLGALDARVAVMSAQDRAALAADVPAFVRSLGEVDANAVRVARSALVFGAVRCAQ